MSDLEKLKEIGATEIHKKTHISVAEINAIFNKDFSYFNRAKALGFIKILEREYGVDLSLWSDEYKEYDKDHAKEDGIFVSAEEEREGSSRVVVVAIIVAAVAVALFLLFSQEPKDEPVVIEQDLSVIEEAKEAVVQNSLDLNESEEEPVTEEIKEEPVVAKNSFYIESSRDLWIGIYYNDNGQREGNVSKGIVELDPNRNQVITLGHGDFKLVYKDEVIEPKSNNLYRYRLKDGVLTKMSTPVITPKTETNQSTQQ